MSKKQKSLHYGRLRRYFSFLFLRASLLKSDAKVKKEAKSNCIHHNDDLLTKKLKIKRGSKLPPQF
ncbi:hypothetical protein CV016_19315 [Yersinia kristensenii]|nr:hypothetical protein CU276_19230 [Yersinia kristensenii]PJG61112.1 hypothetical protein CV016_19315 [Yersinia kristensenii]